MSGNVVVVGVRDLDVEFEKMIRAKEAIEDAGLTEFSKSLEDYFQKVSGYDAGEHSGFLRQEAEEVDIRALLVNTKDGILVDLKKLPKDVTKIRVSIG